MTEKSFKSNSDNVEIFYYAWEVKNPKATFQIVHGSIEHALRYSTFAKELNNVGFSVFAMDLRGHGKTGNLGGNLGHIADHDGSEKTLKDVNQLNNIIRKKEYGNKLVLLGHSMGSFIIRAYATVYKDFDIMICIGTNHKPLLLIKMMSLIAQFNSIYYANKPAIFLSNISYKSFGKKFKEGGELAWLSSSIENQKAYAEDPLTKFKMSNKSFYVLTQWMKMFTISREIVKMDKKLRILLLNGTKDPVGSMGKEVIKANQFYTKWGYISKHIQYEEMRHEILNDTKKELVYKDIIKFVNVELSK